MFYSLVKIYNLCCGCLFTGSGALSEMILNSSTALLTSGNLYGVECLDSCVQRNPNIHQQLQHISMVIWVIFGHKSNSRCLSVYSKWNKYFMSIRHTGAIAKHIKRPVCISFDSNPTVIPNLLFLEGEMKTSLCTYGGMIIITWHKEPELHRCSYSILNSPCCHMGCPFLWSV